MEVLTWAGTVASLGGAGISIWQATRSRSSAQAAGDARDEIVQHRETSELAQVQIFFKKALRSMEKYGPGSLPTSVSGSSQGSDAAAVQELIVALNEHRDHFAAPFQNEADSLCTRLHPLLDAFAKSKPEDLRFHGKALFTELTTFSSVIKRRLDARLDTLHGGPNKGFDADSRGQ